ncbi:MAG: ComF family protein [Xanthomonadaceae bacterium]|nr:ComF family protein [Xanthomonadaceae bacterium]
MIAINPQKIQGKWHAGIALDFHTLSSTPIGYDEHGHMQFDTRRPAIAELLYQLKYKGDRNAAQGIIAAASTFLKPQRQKFDLIIPVPSSTPRALQPVTLLAQGIGAAVGLPVIECISTTRVPAPLKGIEDPARRAELLKGLFAVDVRHTARKRVLLFDDLYRSGSTLNAITDVLLQAGQAATVSVLTITRTRSHH